MRKGLFLLLFHAAFQVALTISDYDMNMPMEDEPPFSSVWDFEDLSEREQPLSRRYETFADGPPPPFPPSEKMCRRRHIQCLQRSEYRSPVCTYHGKYGLVSFNRECDIYLENCLIESYETTTGRKSIKEPYYYNGIRKHCQYYIDQAYTVENAIQLYYMMGRVQKTRRNEELTTGNETENSTTVEQ